MHNPRVRLIANISMLFSELALADRFGAAAEAGFDGVELLFPYDQEPGELRRLSVASGMPVLQINTPRGDGSIGEVGTAGLAGEEARFHEGFERALQYVQELGCPQLHVLSGRLPAASPLHSRARETLIANFTWAAEQAARRHLTILIEALNSYDFPDYLVPTPASALELIRAIDRPNVKLQFDLYHSQLMAGNLTRTLEGAADCLGHVQIAGVPQRHEPDTGEVDYRYVLGLLAASRYRGAISAEYHPSGRTQAGLGWIAHARAIIRNSL